MKKIASLIALVAFLGLVACGSKSPLERLEGRWLLEKEGTYIGVDIESDGTGEFDVSAKDYNGKNQLIMKAEGEITVDGDNLYLTLENGTQCHLYIDGDQLYSNDHQPFRKIK